MKLSRRDFLKISGALGSLTVFGIGYAKTAQGIIKGWWAGKKPADALAGDALEPEVRVDQASGKVMTNARQTLAHSVCVGCTSLCGVRVRIDGETGRVIRVTGSPYHVLSADPFIPYDTPILDSYRLTSAYQEQGLQYRATACGRGNAVLDKLYDPYRVRKPLKRVGPRGMGQWQEISFEQLVEEVVEGGDLFGEGQVAGLRAIRSFETLIDPEAPELGPQVNQLAFLAGFSEGRIEFAQRFVLNSFGTINFSEHRGNCGLSMRAGYAALLNNWQQQPHLKPDFQNCEYVLNIGTAPANAGNPFKRQAKLVAEGRSQGRLKSVVVDPVLTNADSLAAGAFSQWIPVTPGTDGALAMGLIRWILENKRYNAAFLSQPNREAAAAAGEPSWSNATHLVIVDPVPGLAGKFLRGSHLGWNEPGDEDPLVVFNPAEGALEAHNLAAGPAELFYTGQVIIQGESVTVKSAMQLLLEESQKHSLEEYSQACSVPVETMIRLAQEFTSHGRRAAADCHGGTMHTSGFYTAYAIVVLNALIGNLNWKGGTSVGGGKYADYTAGPRYDFANFPDKTAPKGVRISRRGFAYEKTSEFARLKEAGVNPYPAKAPWYPVSAGVQAEYIPSALNGYPYSLKALMLWNTNPLYGQAGLYEAAKEGLADPKRIPLVIAIDPFINESTVFADYIVPDTVLYETWGACSPWGATLTKVSSVRWPAVDPGVARTADGDPLCLESFLIAVAKRMDLPGFGEAAIPDMEGNLHPLNHPQDWHLRVAANIAFDGEPVPEARDDELAQTGVSRILGMLEATLKPEERRRVAYVLARGGRFEPAEKAYVDEWLGRRYQNSMQLYEERIGSIRSSLTGKLHSGLPTWQPQALADGTPLEDVFPHHEWPFLAVSTKSQLISAPVIGADRLQAIQPSNAVLLHKDDAGWLGIRTGDRVRVTSPGGSIEGIAVLRQGLARGVVGIEHGYGHWALGARAEQIDGRPWHASKLRAAGLALNRLGLQDPSRIGISTLGDPVVGSNARQALPVQVTKI
jgi:tetrathionate reductase subunit A